MNESVVNQVLCRTNAKTLTVLKRKLKNTIKKMNKLTENIMKQMLKKTATKRNNKGRNREGL